MNFPELRINLGPALQWSVPRGLVWGLMLIWLIGYTNAFNFMDGINGLAAGQAALTASAWRQSPGVPLATGPGATF